jgi:hypothetical protein
MHYTLSYPLVLPPERRCGGVVVIALCCADCSTELSGVAHVPRKPTNNLDHLLMRNSLPVGASAALAMIGVHTAFWTGTLVLQWTMSRLVVLM